jgi:hypothetical protein
VAIGGSGFSAIGTALIDLGSCNRLARYTPRPRPGLELVDPPGTDV